MDAARYAVLTAEARADLLPLQGSREKDARSIVARVRALRAVLLADCLHGEVVKKRQIPKALRNRFSVENLYVEDLPSFWRLLYTVARDRGDRYVVVVHIVDHTGYSKWFPGRRQ